MADITLNQEPVIGGGVVGLRKEQTVEARSIWGIAFRRYRKHRMAVFGLFLFTFILLFVTVGAIFFSEAEGNRTNTGNKERAPYIAYPSGAERLPEDLLLPAAVAASIREATHVPPTLGNPFGTDGVGRNILVRIIYGGQISLAIGVIAVTISISVGTLVGLIGGYFGGWVDAVLSRITEAMLSIPILILLLVLSSVLSQQVTTTTILGRELSSTVVIIVLLIGLTSWMQLSRIVRAQVLSLKEQEFIVAARALGVRNRGIIFRHLLPNLIAPIVVSATLGIGQAIISEAYLSFLGFGVRPPTATWGNILAEAQTRIEALWWIWAVPGLFIVATVLAINFIGDGLRDAFDPRSLK